MNIICSIFGHRFAHDLNAATGTWSRQWFGSKPLGDWYRTLNVPKECARCGYRHNDTLVVPAEWAEKPTDGPLLAGGGNG